MQRAHAAAKSFFLLPKRRKTYGCEMPARRAMSSVDVPCSPFSANSIMRRVEDALAPFLAL